MQKHQKWVIWLVALLLLFGAASLLYRKLAGAYAPQGGGLAQLEARTEDAPNGADAENGSSAETGTSVSEELPEEEQAQAGGAERKAEDLTRAEKAGTSDGRTSDEAEGSENSAAADANQSETQAQDADAAIAPDFTVYDEAGNAVQLSSFRGAPVVINFWATWCPPCKEELPYFQKAYEQYGDRVRFLMVNLTDGQRETKEIVQKFTAEHTYSFPVYYDTDYDAAITYGVSSVPATLLLNADGKLAAGQVGMVDEASLLNAIGVLYGEAE